MKSKTMIRILMVMGLLLLGAMLVAGQQPNKPEKVEFSAADRGAIASYYKHLSGTLAPASLDRKGFPPEIERALRPGNKVPMQLEKQLERLPKALEDKLRLPPSGYEHYKLGNHVLLVRISDRTIGDIVRDAGSK